MIRWIYRWNPWTLWLLAGSLLLSLLWIQTAAAQDHEFELDMDTPAVFAPPVLHVEQVQGTMNWRLEAGAGQRTTRGTLTFQPPHAFQFEMQPGSRRDLHYRGITATYERGRVEYTYEPSEIFSVLQQLYLPLLQITDAAGEWEGEERIGGRLTYVYQQQGPMGGRYWLDQQTGLPLQGELDDQLFLSFVNYQTGVPEIGTPAQVELDWERDGFSGSLQLIRLFDSWLPNRLEVTDDSFSLELRFSDWDVSQTQLELIQMHDLKRLIGQASIAQSQERWDDVLRYYPQILKIDPYFSQAYFYLGYAHSVREEHRQAVEYYQQWLMLNPGQPLAMNNLAYSYMSQEIRLNEALELAEAAVAAERNPAYLDTLGYGYYLLGQPEKAILYLEESLETIAESVREEVLQHLILAHEAMGHASQVEEYRRQLEVDYE